MELMQGHSNAEIISIAVAVAAVGAAAAFYFYSNKKQKGSTFSILIFT
jgi:hypothetical protein